MLHTQVALLDELLQQHAEQLGTDYTAYRNHCYRVLNFCAALSAGDAETLQKIAIAIAFHDLGIWTDRTFDYLPPSEKLALAYLERSGQAQWQAEIGAMINEHHKVTRYRAASGDLVEAFRKADWVDVSHGIIAYGVSRRFLREVFAAFPNAGFHKRLVQLTFKRLLSHPFSPMPMMRW